MKKFLTIIISIILIISLTSCGKNKENEVDNSENSKTNKVVENNSNNNSTGYKVAMITDIGDVDDGSFNQAIYKGCKEFSEENNINLEYFVPKNDNDSDRLSAIKEAVNNGNKIIVLNGVSFSNVLEDISNKYNDVKFIGVDISEEDIDIELSNNIYCISYKEEIAGFLAGVAAVKLGYRDLGFLGGKEVPAVKRYGYGFIQGADYAASTIKGSNVNIKYVYANQFNSDSKITAYIDKWYNNGTELIFVAGGNIFNSVAESASKYNGKLIGSDVDQINFIDQYGSGMAVTSAMKNLTATMKDTFKKIVIDKKWDECGGTTEELGLISGTEVEKNYVKLPIESTQWDKNFTKSDYKKLVKKIFDGNVKLIGDTSIKPNIKKIKISYKKNIK